MWCSRIAIYWLDRTGKFYIVVRFDTDPVWRINPLLKSRSVAQPTCAVLNVLLTMRVKTLISDRLFSFDFCLHFFLAFQPLHLFPTELPRCCFKKHFDLKIPQCSGPAEGSKTLLNAFWKYKQSVFLLMPSALTSNRWYSSAYVRQVLFYSTT